MVRGGINVVFLVVTGHWNGMYCRFGLLLTEGAMEGIS